MKTVFFVLISAFMVGMNIFARVGFERQWPVETQVAAMEPSMFDWRVLVLLVAAIDTVATLVVFVGGGLIVLYLFRRWR